MKEWYPILVLAPVLGLTVYCVAQLLASRFGQWQNPYASLTIGFIVGLAVMLALSIATLGWMGTPAIDTVSFLCLNIASYLALAFGYFNFVNLTIASLRIRILEELLESGGSMPIDRLLLQYNSENVITARLQRLVSGGHLLERSGHFYIRQKRFLLVARVFDCLRWFILG